MAAATATMGSRLRAAFSENLGLKALSFLIALFLYSLFHGAQDAQRSLLVDLVVLMPPDSANRMLVSTLPPQVRVTLRGSRAALDELRSDDVGNIQVDVRNGSESRVTFDGRMLHVPPSVQVEQFDPPAIDLVWEDNVVRDVPIQVSVVGTPAPGFVVKGAPVADPPTVRVQGPKNDVLVLQHVRADAFDVTGLSEGTYSRHLALDRLTGRHVMTDPSMQSVVVTTEITREVVERPFVKVPVAVVGHAKAKAQPTEVDIRLVCPPEILRGLRAEQVVPRVTVKSNAASGSESLPVELAVEGCEAHITPSSVVVRW